MPQLQLFFDNENNWISDKGWSFQKHEQKIDVTEANNSMKNALEISGIK